MGPVHRRVLVRHKRFTFWCGWEVDDDVPDEHMATRWPAGMKGWITGYSDSFSTFAGRVDAKTASDAERVIRGCYGKSSARIRMRWEPKQHEHGWRPTDGRFPE